MDKATVLKEKIKSQNKKCFWCNELTDNHNWPELDHIIPKSWGGLFTRENTVMSCHDCNKLKGNRMWIKSKSGKTAHVYYLDSTETNTTFDKKNKTILINTIIKIK